MFLLVSLTKPDIIFFIVCAAVIVLIVIIYFLIPVIKHRQYAEARESLKKREAIFNENRKQEAPAEVKVEVSPEEPEKASDQVVQNE